MKTRFYNILVPKFLRNFDDYLLRNYPVVWRTKAIFVLFYGLIGAVLLFAAGFFYTVDAQHLTVVPTVPIELGYDTYHLWSAGLISISILYWAFCQYQLDFTFTKTRQTLLTLMLYNACFWFLFGIVSPAFRMGTIVKTAYCWIDEKDIHKLEVSGIYPYGFLLTKEDTTNRAISDTAFWKDREAKFMEIYKIEDTLFQLMYFQDTTFWINWINTHGLIREDSMFYISELSYNSYKLHLSNRYLKDYLSMPKFITTTTYLSTLSYKSLKSYDSYHLYRLKVSDFTPFGEWNYSIIKEYSFFKKSQLEDIYEKYKFDNAFDTIKVITNNNNDHDHGNQLDSILYILRPKLPYSVENALTSIKHARLYYQNGIFIRHWFLFFPYFVILSILLYYIPFLSIRHLFGLSTACIMGYVLIAFIMPEKQTITTGNTISNIAYLIVPVLSCLLISFSAFKKQKIKGFILAIQGLFVGLLFVLIGALFIIWRVKFNFISIETYQPPYNLAFYGIQILGVIGAVLTTYVRTLPKQ